MAARLFGGITEIDPPNPLNVNYVPEGIDDPRMVDKRFLFINKYNRKVDGEYGDKFIPQPDYFRLVWDAWVDLGIMFSERYDMVKEDSPIVMEVAKNAILAYRDDSKKKLNLSGQSRTPTDIVITAMKCCVKLFGKINEDLENGTMDFKLLNKLVRPFTELVDTIMGHTWTCNSAVVSAMLDVLAAVGKILYSQLEERHHNLMVFLIQVATADSKEVTPQVKAKIGRCIGKYLEFDVYKSEHQFLVDVFDICEQCVVNSENAIKVSYAWTFAGWTDILKDEIPAFGENDFVIRILKTCRNMLAVPTKAKYNCGRACGNVFAWLKESHLEVPEIKVRVEELKDALVPLIGSGADYKFRWNVVYAVGCIFENAIFFTKYGESMTVPIVEQLALKLPVSQNFKERSICLAALCKVSSKGMYGEQYVGIWKKLLDCLGKPPVESSDSNNKFNIECLKLFFHLVVMLETQDVNGISDRLNSNVDYLREIIVSTTPSLLSEQMDKAVAAPDVLKTVKERTRDRSDFETVTLISDLVDMSLRISQGQRYDT
ncbi:unnamed protein product [Orchesella dallaii]|uniref:Uncharacterized protein n=1 Tax=Orchesella dallaii TaxID=48710 RepID=A0ABP1PN45_9HEXA